MNCTQFKGTDPDSSVPESKTIQTSRVHSLCQAEEGRRGGEAEERSAPSVRGSGKLFQIEFGPISGLVEQASLQAWSEPTEVLTLHLKFLPEGLRFRAL